MIAELVGRTQPRVLANRAACVAELSRIAGSEPAAWQDAERLSQAIDDTYQVAYTRWRCAEALIHATGISELVQDLASQAFRTADELGARPLRDGVETLARAARIDLGPHDNPGARTDSGLDRYDLTPRELEVLALLGKGMTNREIAATLVISDKTASVHVSRILAKLVSSRTGPARQCSHRDWVSRPAPISSRHRRSRPGEPCTNVLFVTGGHRFCA